MWSVRNLSLGARLGAGFAIVMACIIAVGAIGMTSIRDIKEDYESMANDRMAKVLAMRDVKDNVNEVARAIRTYAIMKDAAGRAQQLERIKEARASSTQIQAKLKAEIKSAKGQELLAAIMTARVPYGESLDKTLALFAAGKEEEAREYLLAVNRPAQNVYLAAVDGMTAFQNELMKQTDTEVDAEITRAGLLIPAVSGFAILLGVFIAWWVTRSVTRPIGTAMKLAETIAAGDLTSHIEVTSTDETGRLLGSMKKMNESLRGIVGNVRQSADSIATGSTQIATGTQDLSSRTEEQASNLQETAASMEQLTATVKQTGESAAQANQLATTASAAAANGGVVVEKVVKTMEQITTQSHKIADIITVIDGIAFQTNILALNASVEAARAGEQGRGFAVVAGEVRNLAQRSAQAAREIKTLINTSVEQIETGGVLVQEAGKTMNEIVGQVKQVSDLIGEITAASKEEGTGIIQINDAVTQLDQVTQQNAALVEESAAAADSLKGEAQRLAQAVSVFRLAA